MTFATLHPLEMIALTLLAVIYFLIAVFRGSYAELNSVAAARILEGRGLGPREGDRPGDIPSVMRTTFDLVHHVVLIASAAICFDYLAGEGVTRIFLVGAAILGVAVVTIQVLARALAIVDPEKAFSASLRVMGIFYMIISPLAAPVAWTIKRVRQLGRDRRLAEGDEEASQEEIEAFIDAGQKEGILEAEEGKFLRQVVEFHDAVVREIMTQRTEMVALPRTATVSQARDLFAKERHSRIPVYRDQIDNVEGIINLKDLVAGLGTLADGAPIDSLLRPAYFVPESKQVAELLKEFQAKRTHLAIVVDEYGGVAGLVTIEDLLEQLVGDIQEEHEKEEAPVVSEGDGRYIAVGTASLDDLKTIMDREIDAEGIETISGLIYSILGRIPAVGESVEHDGLRIEVVKADRRKIDRVRISKLQETQAS